jgi:hypothetical protein
MQATAQKINTLPPDAAMAAAAGRCVMVSRPAWSASFMSFEEVRCPQKGAYARGAFQR